MQAQAARKKNAAAIYGLMQNASQNMMLGESYPHKS